MDKEDLNKLIDLNLRLVYKADLNSISRAEFKNLKEKQLSSSEKLQLLMIEYDLIKDISTKPSYINLTQFGIEVMSEYDGWLKYLEYKKIKTQNNIKKENLDLKISEFQVVTRNLPFIFSSIGIILSIIAITLSIIQYSVDKDSKMQDKTQEEKVVKEQQHKVSLTKKDDSTNP